MILPLSHALLPVFHTGGGGGKGENPPPLADIPPPQLEANYISIQIFSPLVLSYNYHYLATLQ